MHTLRLRLGSAALLLAAMACGSSGTGGKGGAGTTTSESGTTVSSTSKCTNPAESDCGGSCVDTQSDADHCGGCDVKLDFNMICVAGAPACSDPTRLLCDGDCEKVSSSTSHCGACGRACMGAFPECVGGTSCTSNEYSSDGTQSCSTICGAFGYQCTLALADYLDENDGTALAFDIMCSQTPPATMGAQYTYFSTRCECELTF